MDRGTRFFLLEFRVKFTWFAWWWEKKELYPPPTSPLRPLPPGKLARAQATLQTQFSYLLCDLMYIHVNCCDELLLTVIS